MDGIKRITIRLSHRLTLLEMADCLAAEVDMEATPMLESFEANYGSRTQIIAAARGIMAAGQWAGDDEYFERIDPVLREAALKHVKKYFPEF